MKKFLSDKLDYEKINEVVSTGNRILKIVYAFLLIIGVYLITLITKEWHLWSIIGGLLKVLTPFFLGFSLAWLLNPLVLFLEKHRIRKAISITAIYVMLLAIVYLFFAAFMPIILDQVKVFAESIPEIGSSLNTWLTKFLSSFGNMVDVKEVKTIINHELLGLATNLSKDVPIFVINSLSNLFVTLLSIIIGMIVGFYLLLDYRGVFDNIARFIPKKHRSDIKYLLTEINHQLHTYIRGLLIVLMALFIVCTIVFTAIGLKAAILLAFVCTIFDVIPYIGPYIGGAAAVLMAFSQSVTIGIITIVAIVVIQQIEGNILQPLIMGKAMKLHPVTIIVGLLVCGYFFGILGMILATPIVAVVKTIFNFYDQKYRITTE